MSENDAVIEAIMKNKPGIGEGSMVESDGSDTARDSVRHHIVMVIDRSGSMATIKADAEGGVNAFIDDQKKASGEATLTIVEFDHEYDVVYENGPIQDYSTYTLRPRGSTALLDAMMRALADAEKIDVDGSKFGVIVTDGGENSSHEVSRDDVFKRVSDLKEKGWDFIFLAANQDAISAGGSLGVAHSHSVNFNNETIAEGYSAASLYMSTARSSGSSMQAEEQMRNYVKSSGLGDQNAHLTEEDDPS